MIYHPLDFFILKSIIEKDTTTWEIAKKFEWNDLRQFKDDKEKVRFLYNKCECVRQRLLKMSDEGIVIVAKTKNSKRKIIKFLVVQDKVIFKRCNFPDCSGKSVYIKESDNKWKVFQL